MNFIQIVPASNTDQMEIVWAIRRVVFVEEQNCPEELEYEFEEESHHFLAFYKDEAAGVCRWRKTNLGIKLERFAVLPQFRRKGVADALVKYVLNEVLKFEELIYLHAQVSAMPLYLNNGFLADGEMFIEADIEHYKMIKI